MNGTDGRRGLPGVPATLVFEVPPEVRARMFRFAKRSFAAGIALAVLASWTYWKWSPSNDRVFHAMLIAAALGFIWPMFGLSVKLMLEMFFMNYHGLANQADMVDGFKDLKEDAKAILADGKDLVHGLRTSLEKYSKDDTVKAVAEALNSWIERPEGLVARLEEKFDQIVAAAKRLAEPPGRPPGGGLLERGIKPPKEADGPAAGAKDETRVLEPSRKH